MWRARTVGARHAVPLQDSGITTFCRGDRPVAPTVPRVLPWADKYNPVGVFGSARDIFMGKKIVMQPEQKR
ncbi:MAG: hypothetical protein D3922_13520 [Candidatus Electrothrix sp. AR1]|nr:hypothetical protein [Candidatus Electrothrix sp. AR1]